MQEKTTDFQPVTTQIIVIEGEKIAIIAHFPTKNRDREIFECFSEEYSEHTQTPPLYNILPKYYRLPTEDEKKYVNRFRVSCYGWNAVLMEKTPDIVPMICRGGRTVPFDDVSVSYRVVVQCADYVPTKIEETEKSEWWETE